MFAIVSHFPVAFYIVLVWKNLLKVIVAVSRCLKRKKMRTKSLHLISIQHVEQPSTSTHATFRSFRVRLKLSADNVKVHLTPKTIFG